MQFNYSQWQAAALGLCFAIPMVAQPSRVLQSGCAANPLSIVIKELHIRQESSLEALAKIAFEHKICIGLEVERDRSLTMDEENISVSQALAKLFPRSLIHTEGSVIQIGGPGKEASWLDYKINLFKVPRASLYFCGMQLFFDLRGQVHPQAGYIGSLAEPAGEKNMVDAFLETDHRVRGLLNELLSRSSAGGIWVVSKPALRSEDLDENRPFWRLLSFGDPVNEALAR